VTKLLLVNRRQAMYV